MKRCFKLGMVVSIFILINTFVLLLTLCIEQSPKYREGDGIQVLFLMPGHIGANNFLIRDVFEAYGWQVTKTAVADAVMPCAFWGRYEGALPLLPDMAISEVKDITQYDCVFIPTAPGNAWKVSNAYQDLLESPEALDLVTSAVQNALPVFAMCAGVRVLAAADVIRGKTVVGSPRFKDEFTSAGAVYAGNENNDTEPCIDGNVITGARGQTYNYSIGQAIATVLEKSLPGGDKILDSNHITQGTPSWQHEDTEWIKTYGGRGSDGGRAMCHTPDGGFLITGYTFVPGQKDADILVIKTDAQGNMIWTKTYGGRGTEYGNGCIALSDGYLIAGYTTSYGSGGKDVYVIKIDARGNEIWSQTYGGVNWDVATSVCKSGDGGYFVCGFTHSFGAGEEDVYLLKIDSKGNEIWSRTYGGDRIEMGNSVSLTEDGGCMMAGVSLTYGGKNTDFWIIKTDVRGDRLWAKAYGANPKPGHGFDWCKAARLTRDGGVVATGYSDTNDLMDAVVLKTDAQGDTLWLQTMGSRPFYQYGNDVCETPEGCILLTGVTKSMRTFAKKHQEVYNNDIYLVQLNARGEIQWEKTIGGSGSDWANAITVNEKDGCYVLGHTHSTENGSLDVCLLKVTLE